MRLRQAAINKLCAILRANSIGMDEMEWNGLRWRVNRGAPYFGIYESYPVNVDFPHNIDELYDESWYSFGGDWHLDVAISHKGVIAHGIFVVDDSTHYTLESATHVLSRLKGLDCIGCEFWAIKSDDILDSDDRLSDCPVYLIDILSA